MTPLGDELHLRPAGGLSYQEMFVLAAASLGYSVKETARLGDQPPETVKGQRARVIAKLGAANMAHAVGIAFRTGLLPLPRSG